MKTRNGFVSNSSSSSFLIVFPEPVDSPSTLGRILDIDSFTQFFRNYIRTDGCLAEWKEAFLSIAPDEMKIILYHLYRHNAKYGISYREGMRGFLDIEYMEDILKKKDRGAYRIARRNPKESNEQLMFFSLADCEPIENDGKLTPLELALSKEFHCQPDCFMEELLRKVSYIEEDHH